MTKKITQNETELELEIIDRLSKYGWTPRPDLYYKTETELLANWRAILNAQNKDRLQGVELTDNEFGQLTEHHYFWSFFGDMMLGVVAIAMKSSAKSNAQPAKHTAKTAVLTLPY